MKYLLALILLVGCASQGHVRCTRCHDDGGPVMRVTNNRTDDQFDIYTRCPCCWKYTLYGHVLRGER